MLKSHPETLDPQEIAGRALGFLAADAERLGTFLALSGLQPSNVRHAARDPGFLPAVLDHLLGDEKLLVAFTEAENLRPSAVSEARHALAGR